MREGLACEGGAGLRGRGWPEREGLAYVREGLACEGGAGLRGRGWPM